MRSLIVPLLVVIAGCDSSAPNAGEDGVPGPQGPAGDVGPAGPTGPQGVPGPQGPQGAVGTQGPVGPAGAQGSAGPQGVVGPMGPQGEVGPQGMQGNDGVDGINGMSTIILDKNGRTLGFPVTIDRGTGFSLAVYAYQLFPAAGFPQDLLISATPLDVVYYTSSNCTGTPHIKASELSATFREEVHYVLGTSGQIFYPTTGQVVPPTGMFSFSTGNGCGMGGAAVDLLTVVKSDKTLLLNKPWRMSHN